MQTLRLKAVAASLALAGALSAQAAAVFTTDLFSFTTANAGLTVEGFENANIGSGTDAAFSGPLSATTNNALFATNAVAAGFSVSATDPANSIYVSRDFGGNTGANISSNIFSANLNISFLPGVTAIGIDLLQWQENDDAWSIEIYDLADNLIGSFAVGESSFVGVTSDVAIGRMFLDKPDTGAVIDNLRFGGAAVPEPGTLLLVASAAFGLVASSRRRQAP